VTTEHGPADRHVALRCARCSARSRGRAETRGACCAQWA